jgi:hypothetical protein
MLFGGERSNALHAALRDACNTITRMPAHYMIYPGGGPRPAGKADWTRVAAGNDPFG